MIREEEEIGSVWYPSDLGMTLTGRPFSPIFRPVTRYSRIQPDRLSGWAVAMVVKRAAEDAGFDPAKYAGHSLRAGLATAAAAAAAAGVPASSIQAQTGHKSLTMLHRYIRPATVFTDNAAAQVGL